MMMILGYLIIGLLYSSITMYPVARDVGQRKKHDGVYIVSTFIISIAFAICLAPFWIILLGFNIAKWFYKWKNRNQMKCECFNCGYESTIDIVTGAGKRCSQCNGITIPKASGGTHAK
ncbi:TPA: hypothetical protein QCU10_001456 [Bacillus anthracis]|nr:hypothetical protein [Bacillus cereus biovar anthracis]HDR6237694.1 hypothetical protein [Bacillus cereus biovar anthracis]HDR6248853.1 hypothetical protein [Bacillus cereus biovar anthracis]